jgi:hypothetical protein
MVEVVVGYRDYLYSVYSNLCLSELQLLLTGSLWKNTSIGWRSCGFVRVELKDMLRAFLPFYSWHAIWSRSTTYLIMPLAVDLSIRSLGLIPSFSAPGLTTDLGWPSIWLRIFISN